MLEHQQELRDARLAGAITTKKHGDRREANVAGIGPHLKIFDPQMREHCQTLPYQGAAQHCLPTESRCSGHHQLEA